MKLDFQRFKPSRQDFTPKHIKERIIKLAKGFWGVLSRRFWLKLMSLFLAILLWTHVVSNDSSITRNKILNGLDGFVTNQATLASYKLALLDDPTDQLEDVTVRLQVAQSEYVFVTPDNVKVSLDLSGVRNIGTQQVPLKATTAYGRVVEIIPSSLMLTFETLDSRSVPVKASVIGNREEYWYNASRTNPSAITVSGAASIVQSITAARVVIEVTDTEEGSFTSAEDYDLLDGDGNVIPQEMLSCSSSSISVTADVYPIKELPISDNIESVVNGKVAEGYEITDVTIEPDTVTVAADRWLLEGMDSIRIEPVSVDNLDQSISVKANVSRLADFRYVSAEEVYVNITISPVKVPKTE